MPVFLSLLCDAALADVAAYMFSIALVITDRCACPALGVCARLRRARAPLPPSFLRLSRSRFAAGLALVSFFAVCRCARRCRLAALALLSVWALAALVDALVITTRCARSDISVCAPPAARACPPLSLLFTLVLNRSAFCDRPALGVILLLLSSSPSHAPYPPLPLACRNPSGETHPSPLHSTL